MFDFTVTNADGSHPGIKIIDYRLEKFFDRAGTLELQVDPESSAVSENSTIEAAYEDSVRFRGWIDYPEVKNDGGISIRAHEQQKLLEYRACQTYNYIEGTTISTIIGSSAAPGLLYFANSLIPQGSFSLHSGSVYKLVDYLGRGAGTSSRFGTISSMYQNAIALTKGSSASLSVGQWYQDSDHLYVRTTDSKDPKYYSISIPNWKDTLLRIGNIDAAIASETFSVPYRTGKNKIEQEVTRLINAFGLEYQWRHDRDGYTYLDIQETIGRGTSTKGVARYRHGTHMFDYEKVLTGDPRVNCLIGAGAGNGYSLQTSATMDAYSTGTWKEEIYSDSHQFTEQLSNTLTKIFPDRKDGLSYNLTIAIDPLLECGDYINISPLNHSDTVQRVKKITYRSDGSMDIEAGRRLLDPVDVTKSKFDMLADFSTAANGYLNSWTFQFNSDKVTDTVPYSVNFVVNSDEIDTNFDYRFLLNLNVDWYKSSVQSVTTSSHAHSGSTGSGGSHEHGGETQEGGAHDHDTFEITSYPEENAAVSVVTSLDSDGDHGHTTSISLDGSHDHNITPSGSWDTTDEEEDHAHGYFDFYHYDYTQDDGDHQHIATVYYNGDHNHGKVIDDAAMFRHDHLLPVSNVSVNPNDTRGIDTMPSDTRPMVTQSSAEDDTDYYCVECETGSIRYLTITVKVNSTQVAGSPFEDYYPGDSISDIDITDLVSSTAQNTIEISIAEYSGANSVRCSINGSVSAKYTISSI